jgi:hypothetical protein
MSPSPYCPGYRLPEHGMRYAREFVPIEWFIAGR